MRSHNASGQKKWHCQTRTFVHYSVVFLTLNLKSKSFWFRLSRLFTITHASTVHGVPDVLDRGLHVIPGFSMSFPQVSVHQQVPWKLTECLSTKDTQALINCDYVFLHLPINFSIILKSLTLLRQDSCGRGDRYTHSTPFRIFCRRSPGNCMFLAL